ncbi:MAG: AraC family transcriptional regulator [Bacteroidales bacterium]|jgi:AraC-like DNA-binding protein|nr:AraC family transcriptional regulator [Bacteroidales bacterium]MDD3700493.1 AraC family transcriptional regulator [Bacteroidales bacterium]MDY0369857.1 AraC family transcriptional regulator [Bacteroidales bacterium]
MKLYIKNMVCNRCIMVVRQEMEKLGHTVQHIELGEVVVADELNDSQKELAGRALAALGFELIDDKKARIIEKIKVLIIDLVHYQHNMLKYNISELLSRELNHEYSYISRLFSEVEGVTIEKYFIAQKIEKVKELLVYDELTLSEIAEMLNYSSVAYLSNQFKKVTGLTPTHFKNLKQAKRIPLDQV